MPKKYFCTLLEKKLGLRKKYGVSIEESLRTYAHVLKTTVKQNDIKDSKNRPRNYYQWIMHLKGKVCYLFKQIQNFFKYIIRNNPRN